MAWRCEDAPCCGHGGDCPNPNPRKGFSGFSCVGCGRPLRSSDTSSFCTRRSCVKRERQRQEREYSGDFYESDRYGNEIPEY